MEIMGLYIGGAGDGAGADSNHYIINAVLMVLFLWWLLKQIWLFVAPSLWLINDLLLTLSFFLCFHIEWLLFWWDLTF